MRTIRRASQRDVAAVVHVIKAVYDEYGFTWDPEEYHSDLYDLDGYYLKNNWPFWICEVEGQPAGTVALETFPKVEGIYGQTVSVNGTVRVAGADCELNRLYVHPSARKQGIGELLVNLTIAEALRRGCQAMELWSDKRFGDAHRLYGRFRAEVVGERICDDPDVSPEWGLLIRL